MNQIWNSKASKYSENWNLSENYGVFRNENAFPLEIFRFRSFRTIESVFQLHPKDAKYQIKKSPINLYASWLAFQRQQNKQKRKIGIKSKQKIDCLLYLFDTKKQTQKYWGKKKTNISPSTHSSSPSSWRRSRLPKIEKEKAPAKSLKGTESENANMRKNKKCKWVWGHESASPSLQQVL